MKVPSHGCFRRLSTLKLSRPKRYTNCSTPGACRAGSWLPAAYTPGRRFAERLVQEVHSCAKRGHLFGSAPGSEAGRNAKGVFERSASNSVLYDLTASSSCLLEISIHVWNGAYCHPAAEPEELAHDGEKLDYLLLIRLAAIGGDQQLESGPPLAHRGHSGGPKDRPA